MVRQLLILASIGVILTTSACSDRNKVDINAEMTVKIAEAISDLQEVSNGEFRVQLITYDADEANNPHLGGLLPAGSTHINVFREGKLFLSVLPEAADGSYLISLWNPVEEEMISIWETNAITGVPNSISYSGTTKEGVYFNTSDQNWDGQPEMILGGEQGPTRIWLQERWQEIVRNEGRNGVIVDGDWKSVERNRDTKEHEFSDDPSEDTE